MTWRFHGRKRLRPNLRESPQCYSATCAPQTFTSQNVLRSPRAERAKIAFRRRGSSCMRTIMAHNFRGPPGIDNVNCPKKETSGMRRLWILTFLLMPVFAGGCKMCYSWQLGRDRAPEPAAGMCAPPCATPCETGCCNSCNSCQ